MNSFFRLAPVVLLGLLAACRSDTKTDQRTPAAPDATATPETTAPPAETNSPGASYRQYRGLLPGQTDSITLNLMVSPRQIPNTEWGGSFASYHGSDGHPYQLVGLPTASPDSVLLVEISPEKADTQREAINWRLLRRGNALAGTYKGRPVQLREVAPALRLTVRYVTDSVVAFPGVAKSPVARVMLQTLLASAAPAALNPNILRDLRGDTLPNLPAPQLPQLWTQELARYQKMYREDAAEARKNQRNAPPDDDMPLGYGLSYDEQQSTYVLWNQGPLLSLGFYIYSYTGGAHGNYGTTTATYDTRTGQRLRYEDIFRPNSEAVLSKILDKAVRRTLHIPAAQPLDGTLFVKTMPVTHNVYLTSTGAVFTYTPYEIASYAQGEIPVFVPLTELQPLLQNQPVL